MPSPDVHEEMSAPASTERPKRELYVPDELAPVDGEAAVLSMLVVGDGSEWRVVAGSLLTVPVAVASTSTCRACCAARFSATASPIIRTYVRMAVKGSGGASISLPPCVTRIKKAW